MVLRQWARAAQARRACSATGTTAAPRTSRRRFTLRRAHQPIYGDLDEPVRLGLVSWIIAGGPATYRGRRVRQLPAAGGLVTIRTGTRLCACPAVCCPGCSGAVCGHRDQRLQLPQRKKRRRVIRLSALNAGLSGYSCFRRFAQRPVTANR